MKKPKKKHVRLYPWGIQKEWNFKNGLDAGTIIAFPGSPLDLHLKRWKAVHG